MLLYANREIIQHKFDILTKVMSCLLNLIVSESIEEYAMESTNIYWISAVVCL